MSLSPLTSAPPSSPSPLTPCLTPRPPPPPRPTVRALSRQGPEWVAGRLEGDMGMGTATLGIKGTQLCEIAQLGISVPPAFIIPTIGDAKQTGIRLDSDFLSECVKAVHELGLQTFGGGQGKTPPLLLSLRSSTAVCVPGVHILNVGINVRIVEALIRNSKTKDVRWAVNLYRVFLQSFGTVVLGVDKVCYTNVLESACRERGVREEGELTREDLIGVVNEFKALTPVPDDPYEQLALAIGGIFNWWQSPPTVAYRVLHNIDSQQGTAVLVQSMVYPTVDSNSGYSTVITRNATSGARDITGDFYQSTNTGSMNSVPVVVWCSEHPALGEKLTKSAQSLEKRFKDMQEVQIVVEAGELYVIDTRTAKRSPRAAVCVAASLVRERIITEREALLRLDPKLMDFFLHPMIGPAYADSADPRVAPSVVGKGVGAAEGAVVGHLVFSIDQLLQGKMQQKPCILVATGRDASCMQDLYVPMTGIKGVAGLLILRGERNSFAASVMRKMKKPAVVNVPHLTLNEDATALTSTYQAKLLILRVGDIITLDGSTGLIYVGAIPTVSVGQCENFLTVMQWASKYKRMGVLADVASREEVQLADNMGAEGVGSLRTNFMFSKEDRIHLFRQSILLDNRADRCQCLAQLLPMHQADFLEIFCFMGHRQVTVRLLEPPLQDFLPQPGEPGFQEVLEKLAASVGISEEKCRQRVQMMGAKRKMGFEETHMSVVYPEIMEMQTKAIVGAAIEARRAGISILPQITLPLVCTDYESLNCSLGTMIEVPRACLRADRITEAPHIDFISFASNELTQMMFGFSRFDVHHFISTYIDKRLVRADPFESLDVTSVGHMIYWAIGVSGGHSGDPDSILFFEHIGVDYVSCPPNRVPIAKLAAAQAYIQETSGADTGTGTGTGRGDAGAVAGAVAGAWAVV
ncbi:Pyruvate/Phosphoenolpyruvate kinase-like domain-containing protein [Ochromonadaceae sp. CCMP2298]|nr:Pyruvate/Phosphoenolpyruvate kinase-like domain-containing protein [Ochromonadaceae sp. CCMP2298]